MLAYKCGPAFAGLTGVVIAAYTAFTIGITQWRTRFRQDMNKADSEAGKQACSAWHHGMPRHELSSKGL